MHFNIHHKAICNGRSSLLISNILASFLIKGWSAVVVLLMVPLTLSCLGKYSNGVWLTISSMLVWIDQMDIGLGNGLRNKLASHIAHEEYDEARSIVSSTFAMLFAITIPVILVLSALVWFTDIYTFLNVDPQVIPQMRVSILAAVVIVCMTFVFKFIGNVYMGMQMPAVSNFIMVIGQTMALAATWILYVTGNADFLNIVLVNTGAPLVTYMLAYPYTFKVRYRFLCPTLKSVNMRSALELCNMGLKFFWLQIAGVIQFMTANILISKFFTPAMVTPYQITYRYMSLVMVAFSVICMPFWNATTDAYERGDMDWIRKANSKMNLMMAIITAGMALMVIVSPWLYDVWVGDKCDVPFSMTVMMAIYIWLMVLSMRYSYFLNGVGALRLQMWMTVMTVFFIPLAWWVSKETHDIVCFMVVMCGCIAPSILVNMVQFSKILKGKAQGIWRI